MFLKKVSGCLEQELDLDGLVREDHLACLCLVKDTSPLEGREVRVHGLDVSTNSACNFSHGDRSSATHGLENTCENEKRRFEYNG